MTDILRSIEGNLIGLDKDDSLLVKGGRVILSYNGERRQLGLRSGVAARLIAAYEAQYQTDSMFGPKLLARTGYPVAADVPTITGSATAPSADSDAATQIIYPFVSDDITGNTDPIPKTRLQNKQWVRGFSEALRGFATSNRYIRLGSSVGQYATDGTQLQDANLVPGQSWGIDYYNSILDVILDGDVFFFRPQSGTAGTFELYVNGSFYITTAGTGMTQSASGRALYISSAGYVKIKFGSVDRRRLTLVFSQACSSPGAMYLRATHTLTPAISSPIQWCHIGDSYSTGTGATVRPISLVDWMHAAFGHSLDLINTASGSTSFADDTNLILPGETPTATLKPNMRYEYQLNIRRCAPDVISMLIGVNESGLSQTLLASELKALLIQIRADFPSTLVFVFASNSGPSRILDGSDIVCENTISAACTPFSPQVTFFPLQTWNIGKFLRGTGYVGATTGVGNTDLYTSADTLHPSDAGHRALGRMMARRIYEALKTF